MRREKGQISFCRHVFLIENYSRRRRRPGAAEEAVLRPLWRQRREGEVTVTVTRIYTGTGIVTATRTSRRHRSCGILDQMSKEIFRDGIFRCGGVVTTFDTSQ